MAGPAERCFARSALQAHLGGHGVRGQRRRGQGRGDPPRHRRARCAQLPQRAGGGADRGGTRAALPVALLAPPAAARPLHHSSTAPGTGACWWSGSRGFCSEDDWMRAYTEINDFEQQLPRHGIVVVKFWLPISKEEQFRRFKAREKIGFKRFKITEEDWRNRKKWDAYEQRGLRHGRPHLDRDRAVDPGRGEQQVPCAHQGAQNRLSGNRGRAGAGQDRLGVVGPGPTSAGRGTGRFSCVGGGACGPRRCRAPTRPETGRGPCSASRTPRVPPSRRR